MNKIAELEREVAILPEGNITKKKVNDKECYYLRVNKNGKRKNVLHRTSVYDV